MSVPSRSTALSNTRKRPGMPVVEPVAPRPRHQSQPSYEKHAPYPLICEVQQATKTPTTPSASRGIPMHIHHTPHLTTPATRMSGPVDMYAASPLVVPTQASPHLRGHMQSPFSSTPRRRGGSGGLLGSPSPTELLETSTCLFERSVLLRYGDDKNPFIPVESIRHAQLIGKGSFGVVFRIDVSGSEGVVSTEEGSSSFAIKACKSDFTVDECACMVLLTRLSQMTLRSTPTLDRCTWVASKRPLCSWIGCMLGEAAIDVRHLENMAGLNPSPEYKRMNTMVMQTVTSPESPGNLSDRALNTRDMGCWISMAATDYLKDREQNVKDLVQMLFAALFTSAFCANSVGVLFNDPKVDNVLVESGSRGTVEAVVFDRLDSNLSKRFVYTERVRARVVDASLFTCHAFARTFRTYEDGKNAGIIADALCMNSFGRRSPRPGCSNISDYICFIKNMHNHVCLSSKIASLVVEDKLVESLDKRLNPVMNKLLTDALGNMDVLECAFIDTPKVMFRCWRWFERWISSEEGDGCDELEDWLIEVKNAKKYWSTGDTFKIGLRSLISRGGLELVTYMKDWLVEKETDQIERALKYLFPQEKDTKARVESWKTDGDKSLWTSMKDRRQLASVRNTMLRFMKSNPQLGNAFYVLLPEITARSIMDVQNGFAQLHQLATLADVKQGMFSDVATRVLGHVPGFPHLSMKKVIIKRSEILTHSQDLLMKTNAFDAYLNDPEGADVQTRGLLLPAREQLRRTQHMGVIERTIRERKVVEFDILQMMEKNDCEIDD